MNLRSLLATACLALAASACTQPAERAEQKPAVAEERAPGLEPAISDLKIAPADTIEEIMANHVDVAGDFAFESVADIADEKGQHRKEPRTPDEWNEVREALSVLHDAPIFMISPGRLAAKLDSRADFPAVELEPEVANKLLADRHTDFVVKSKGLQDAANSGLKAVEAKDPAALYKAIEQIDVACESCHLRYWYPNDQRAKEAAKRQGVPD